MTAPPGRRGFLLYIAIMGAIFVIMKKIKFTKYHALGNDFLVIDRISRKSSGINYNEFAAAICSRNLGVGADGILVLSGSRKNDFRLDLYNSDGSWAEKSGNGLRIAAAYYYGNYSRRKNIEIETEVEKASAKVIKANGGEFSIRVCLGAPEFESRKVPVRSEHKFHINLPLKIDTLEYVLTAVSVGNPHAVIFVDNFEFDWKMLGEVIEISKSFPNRTNVEFAKVVNRGKVILNDWERGAGATGSSGTGAGATVAAGVMNGLLDRNAKVVFPLGELEIEWEEKSGLMFLTGPVKVISAGEYYY